MKGFEQVGTGSVTGSGMTPPCGLRSVISAHVGSGALLGAVMAKWKGSGSLHT